MPTLIWLTALWLAQSGAASAHGVVTETARPEWTFDLWIVAPLAVIGLAYLIGSFRIARRSWPLPRGRLLNAAAFWGGWLTVAGALVTPLHWLGERLFTFHMVEHEILMAISAPLLVAARPLGVMLWALPRRARHGLGRALNNVAVRAIWRGLSSGGPATLLHGVVIWVWHAPVLFDAAVVNVALHRAQHLSFLLTALLFWWSVLWRSGAGIAAWHLFITMLHTSILGALMALAPRVLYGAQTADAAQFGLTPLEDQQLAGLIMWVPAGTIYAGATLALLVLWIRSASYRREFGNAPRPA